MDYKEYLKIQNMEKYVNLTHFWAKCKRIKKISGLENQTELQVLDLRRNQIKSIDNINHMFNLVTLNLSFNQIKEISGIGFLYNLKDLDLSSNLIRVTSRCEMVVGLKEIRKLNLKNNLLEDQEKIVPFFTKMQNLTSLNLKGNPFTAVLSFYREKMIKNMPNLKQLDEQMVINFQSSYTSFENFDFV